MNNAKAFLAELEATPPTTKAVWLARVREAAQNYANSWYRDTIAMKLAGAVLTDFKHSADDQEIQPIRDALYELELPDMHIAPGYEDDFNEREYQAFEHFAKVYVDYKWRKLAGLLEAKA